jgi:hypothetical protein
VPLNPGYPRETSAGWVLDEGAVAGSMALKIEDELKAVYLLVKGKPMSVSEIEDLRILLVAIARGVLGHLKDGQDDIMTKKPDSALAYADHTHDVELDVTWAGGP